MTLPTSSRAVVGDRPLGLSSYAVGVLFALAAGIALGTLGPFSNLAYDAGMGSATVAALRATVGAIVLLAATRSAHRVSLGSLPAHDRRMFGIAFAAQAVLQLTIFAAFGAMTVALVLAVYYLYPLVVAGASIALGRERLTVARAVALVLAVGGLLVLILGRLGPDVEASAVGLALAATAGTAQATYVVAARNGFPTVPATQAITVILTGVAVTSWAAAVVVDGSEGRLFAWVGEPSAWVAILVLGVIGAAFAKVGVLEGVRRLGGTRASVILLSEPVAGAVLAVLLLGQPLGWPELVGGAGILAGAALAQRPAPGRVAAD